MTPLALYREGKLREAIKALGEELRSNPLDAKRRTFLFELLLFAGEYDRAEKQLDLLAGANAEAAAGTLLYRSALHAERTRQSMFANRETPPSRQEAVHGGVLDGKAFSEISDSDPRIGANLEVFLAGSYTWIPIHYLRRLEIRASRKSTRLGVGLAHASRPVPTFDCRSWAKSCFLFSAHSLHGIRMSQFTWAANRPGKTDDVYGEIPYGAKMMVVDGADVPLLDIRSVVWSAPEKESQDASA